MLELLAAFVMSSGISVELTVGRATFCQACSSGEAASVGFGPPQGERSSWLAPPGTSLVGLKGSQGSWVDLLPPAGQPSLMLPLGQVGWFLAACREVPQGCVVSKGHGASGAPEGSQSVGWRKGWGCIIYLPFLPRRELRPILVPSGTPPTAGKSFTLLPLLWVSGLVGRACPPHWHGSSPGNHRNPVYCGLGLSEQISRAMCVVLLGSYLLPTLSLSPTCRLGLGEGLGPSRSCHCHLTSLCVVLLPPQVQESVLGCFQI